MSLVLEALRRVEKRDGRTGSVGATVASFRPPGKRGGSVFPLFLGLATGGLAVAFFGPQVGNGPPPEAAKPVHTPRGRAGLPPPIFPLTKLSAEDRPLAQNVDRVELPRGAPMNRRRPISLPPIREAQSAPVWILQAIGERDLHPIAIINDQLVKEGDRLGSALVVKIGPDLVEVILENGKRDTVHFAPPPSEPSPTPPPAEVPGPAKEPAKEE